MSGPRQDSENSSAGPLETAVLYTRRGWSVLPVPFQSKNPGFKGWQRLRLSESDLPQYFNGAPQNIGVLMGEPSRWLVEVDLDHPRAVELAPKYLPPTPAVFGRTGKPRSHWVFKSNGPVATKKHQSKSAGMIVELRSTGAQTVFPPSVHESGEAITWVDENAEPATIDPEVLLECVKRLADRVLEELGEKKARPNRKKTTAHATVNSAPETPNGTSVDRAKLCLQSMLRIQIVDQRDGSHRLFVAACRAVEYDLDDTTAVATIQEYSRQRPFPSSWTDEDIQRRLRDAEKRCTRGSAFLRDNDGCVALGGHDPATGRLVLSPTKTLPTAKAFVREFHDHPDGQTLCYYAGQLLEWRQNRYCEMEDSAVRHNLQVWLHAALRYSYNRHTKELELVSYDSNPGTVKAALDSLRDFTHLPATITSPSWLGDAPPSLPPSEILSCRSTLLHLPTMRHYPATPRFFSVNSLDFDPDPDAPSPMAWLQFLHQLFDDDIESHNLLQEWFGYCLSGDTSQQKMLMVVGPKRSGKGTIARILTRLVGIGNVCGPTISALADRFGMQPLIGKSMAIVSDARFHGEGITPVIERLLCISGEDTLTIDRKFMTSVTMKLPTRFVFLTNEFPRINDASGALPGRFVILRLTESFYGKEDMELTQRLLAELPGILNWAIEGWQRLRERGRFQMPSSVVDVVQEIEDLSSPVSAFVREECEVGPGHRVSVDALYYAWQQWCEKEGRQAVSLRTTFGRDLAAAISGVIRRRGTGQQPFYQGIALKGRSI